MGYGGYGPKQDDSGTLANVAKGVTDIAGSVLSTGMTYLGGWKGG